ncbi:MAG TPA: hypothetical protein VKQ36_14485 [Ktedonobacterales bacterium]|nr:hypothetical protein [Ktedonobacterales bacterium]
MTRYARFQRTITQWADVEIPDDVDDPEAWRLEKQENTDAVYTAIEGTLEEVSYEVLDDWEEDDNDPETERMNTHE